MIIKKIKTELENYDIKLIEEDKIMNIVLGSNGDLYWSLYVKDNVQPIFEITKENKILYNLFQNLYNAIEQCKVYEVDPVQLSFCESSEEIDQLHKRINWMNQDVKTYSNYNKLFHAGIIEWHSDDQIYEDANIVKIYKEEDKFIIKYIFKNNDEFLINSIRFNNNRSSYKPFNLLFMKMYNQLQQYDLENQNIKSEDDIQKIKLLKKY